MRSKYTPAIASVTMAFIAILAAFTLLVGCSSRASEPQAEYSAELLTDPQTRFTLVTEYYHTGITRVADYTQLRDCEDAVRVIYDRHGDRAYCVPHR